LKEGVNMIRFKIKAIILLLIASIFLGFINIDAVKAAEEAGPSIFEDGAKKAIIVKKAAYIDYETAKKYQAQRTEPIDILVNSNNSTVDQWIKDHIKNKGISDVIVLGGHIVFTEDFGQNLGINLIRCGGWDAADTERLLFGLGSKVYNPTQIYHESGKNYAVSVSETSKFTSSIQTSIRNKLAAKDYFGAVDIILDVKPHGSEQRSKDGNYAIAIVLDDTYFYSYANRQEKDDYAVVHSYIYPGRLPTQKTVKKPTLNLNESWTNSNRSFTVSPDPTCTVTSYVEYKIGNGSWTKGTSGTVTAEGQTTVYARAVNDTPGGKKYSETVSKVARIDKTKPSATINPNSSSWTKSNVNFTVTLSDSGGSGLKQWRIRYSSDDGATYGSWSSWNTTTSYSHYLDVEGRRKIQVEVHDNAGNTNIITSGSYLIDKNLPTHVSASISGYRYKDGSGDHWIRPEDTISVIMRGSDALSGILRHYIRFLGINQTTGDIRYYHDWTQASNHMATWDNYGNNSHVEVLSVQRTYNSNGQREVKWQAKLNTDGQSYAAQYYYYDYAWNGIGYNTIGNVRVDGTAPTISISPNSQSWVKGNINVTITATDSGSGVKRIEYMVSTNNGATWPSTWTQVSGNSTTITLSNTGEYKIRARAVDNVDNTSAYKESGTYQIDKQAPDPPTLTLSPDGWTNGNVTATISGGNDAHSGIAKYQYSFDNTNWADYSGAITISNEGTTRIYARTVDKVGNVSASVYKDAKIDRTAPAPPIITVNLPTWTNQNVTVTISPGNDGGSGVQRIEYRINGGSWTTYSSPFILSNQGVYTIEARTIDVAGNLSAISSKQALIDKTPPTVSATPSSIGWRNSNVTVTPSFSDSGGSGLSSRQYVWSTSTSTPSSGWTNYSSGNLTQSNNGTWFLYLRATDTAGNTTTERFGPYQIDKIAPSPPTITVNPSTWTNGTVTVTITPGTDSGGSGVLRTEYRINGGSWTTYSSSFTITTQGTHTIEAITVDVAGNPSPVASKTAYIDKTLPEITANPPNREWSDSPVTVTLNYTDTGGSGIKDKLYAWSNTTEPPADDKWTIYNEPVTQEAPGSWYLHVKATDNAGNQKVTYFGPYIVDKLQYIEVIPSTATIVQTEELPLTVRAVYHLKTEDVTTQAQYMSSNMTIATVDEQGVVTGKSVGQTIIRATYKGKQAQSTITVQEPEKTVTGTLTITKNPTYVFTKWNKAEDGQPSRMNITISWNNLTVLVLRADKTVLRSEPITVTRAESQHRINRYTIPETYSWGTLTYSKLTNYSAGSGSYRAVYEYDKAGKPNSPFTFTGYYTYEGEEKSFSVMVYIPVNGIATTLMRPSVVPLSLGFQPALTNSGNNTWKYSGVWPASGVLTLGGSAGDLAWPVPGSTVISSYFGRRVDPIDSVVRMHYGIDIPAPEGTNIVAPDDGKVVYVGYDEGFGNMLVIRSGIYDFVFGHCSNILVSNGQTVSKGQVIAKVGSTGRATGPHLDFRVTLGPYTQGNYIDPLTVVNPAK